MGQIPRGILSALEPNLSLQSRRGSDKIIHPAQNDLNLLVVVRCLLSRFKPKARMYHACLGYTGVFYGLGTTLTALNRIGGTELGRAVGRFVVLSQD